jgi:hypothetical protein
MPDVPPLLEFHRLCAQVSYPSLFRHTVGIKDLVLEAPAVHLERLASGAVAFPGLRAALAGTTGAEPTTTHEGSTAQVKEPEGGKSAGTPWNVVVHQLSVRAGRISLRDHVSDPPESTELSLGTLSFQGFTLLRSEESVPGHGSIEAKFGDGTVRIDTTVTTRANGYAFEATLNVANLPLDRMQQHAPQLGWSTLTGRLDAQVTLRAEPKELPASSGTVVLSDMHIEVPGEAQPVLAWRKLAIDVEEFGIVRRRAIVKSVFLDGGAVVVTPKDVVPLPLLRRRDGAVAQAGTAAQPESPPATTPAAPSVPARAWVWKVGTVDIVDTRTTIVLEPSPLVVEIANGKFTGLESAPGTRAGVDLQIKGEQGMVALAGKVGIDPPAAQLTAKLSGVAFGRLLAASGTPLPVQPPTGTLNGDVTIQADQGLLIVAGKLAIADLGVRLPTGPDFAVDCKRLEVAIKQVRVPSALPGVAPGIAEPVRVDLDSLKLVAPAATLTRTVDGLVLPRSNATPIAMPPTVVANARPTAKSTKPSKRLTPATAPTSPVAISLALLDLQAGQLSIVDQTLKPTYHGKISALALKARGIRIPEKVFDDIALSATLPGGAPLRLDAKKRVASSPSLPMEEDSRSGSSTRT